MKIRLEFKLQDMWVGVFWKRCLACRMAMDGGEERFITTDIWICLLPCLPIHLFWWRPTTITREEWIGL